MKHSVLSADLRKTEASAHTAVLVTSYDLFYNLRRNSVTEE